MIEYLTRRIIIENEVFNQIVPRIESEGEFETKFSIKLSQGRNPKG